MNEVIEPQTKDILAKVPLDIARPELTKPDIPKKPNVEVGTTTNPYDPPISRKLMEGICGLSTNTLIKYEAEGVIHPTKVKYGGLEVITYRVTDVQAILKKRGVIFKRSPTAEVISVFSQKGGVGKSAFTQHLGSMLSLVGRVLVIGPGFAKRRFVFVWTQCEIFRSGR